MPTLENCLAGALKNYFSERISVKSVGEGFHARGFELIISGEETPQRLFLRLINPVEFGHDLPSDRARTILEAAQPLPNSLATYGILALNAKGKLVDIADIQEVVAVTEFLPPDAINFCEQLRQPTVDREETKQLAQSLETKAQAIARIMAEIHETDYQGTIEEANSLYKRASRAVIHADELTAGVMDLIDFSQTKWLTHEDMVKLLGDMERVRHIAGTHPQRLKRIHGDYWANNIYFAGEETIITDGRLVWGEPGIDVGWMIGEFLMQDLIRFGHFGEDFTQLAQRAVASYIALREDPTVMQFVNLPYAFQAFAEAYFTPSISDRVRRLLLATAQGCLYSRLQGEAFDLNMANTYTANGLELLSLLP